MSPPSTWTICDTAVGAMLPALGAVSAASIFIASIVATVCAWRPRRVLDLDSVRGEFDDT